MKKNFGILLLCGLLFCMSSCDNHANNTENPDSASSYTSSINGDNEYSSEYVDGIDKEKFKDNKVIYDWINLCSEKERDDIGNYALKYTEEAGDYVVYKYLIYRTETDNNRYSQMKFSDSGKILNVEVIFDTKTQNGENTLTFVKFKAPKDKKVLFDIVCNDDYPGYISTVTDYDMEDAIKID